MAGSVKPAREAVAAFARTGGANPDEIELVRLAVSEAVSNAVLHGYRGEPGEIEVIARFASAELWVIVADEGYGFQSRSPTPGQGWGMPLIAHACSEFAIGERSAGGTEVRMRFELDGRG